MMTNNRKLKFDAACLTDAGHARGNNEDAGVADLKRGVFVVADGIGGHQGGEIAARLVVEALPLTIEARLARMVRPSCRFFRTVLRDSMMMLNQQAREYSAEKPGLAGMGATVVVALLRAGFAHIGHMGDSRAYLFRNGELTALTDDHSVVGILVRSGQITVDEAKTHPARGHITRFIGITDDVEPGVRSIRVRKGDRLLLCSDGLTSMVADAAIMAILAENETPLIAVRTLVDAANRAGGKDNITVLVADVT